MMLLSNSIVGSFSLLEERWLQAAVIRHNQYYDLISLREAGEAVVKSGGIDLFSMANNLAGKIDTIAVKEEPETPVGSVLNRIIMDADVDGITLYTGSITTSLFSAGVTLADLIKECNGNPAYKGIIFLGDDYRGEKYWFIGDLNSTEKSEQLTSPGAGLPYTRSGCRIYYKGLETTVDHNVCMNADVDGITISSATTGMQGLSYAIGAANRNRNCRGCVYQPTGNGGGMYWLIGELVTTCKSRSATSPGAGIPYTKNGSYLYYKQISDRDMFVIDDGDGDDVDVDGEGGEGCDAGPRIPRTTSFWGSKMWHPADIRVRNLSIYSSTTVL
jgi:hypothetical protein